MLARDPNLYRAEYWYTPPIHFAVREGRLETTRVLLEAGADPAWRAMSGDDLVTSPATAATTRSRGCSSRSRDGGRECRSRTQPADDPIVAAARSGDLEQRACAPRRRAGRAARRKDLPRPALHAAARGGNRALVELLLAHGADPNFTIDSSGSATWAAGTPELRQLLIDRGGRLDCYDLVFLDEDDEALRRVTADPAEANAGCGGVLAAACTLGKRELVTGCWPPARGCRAS